MLRIIHKLLGRKDMEGQDIALDDNNITFRKTMRLSKSQQWKDSYTTWYCAACGHSYYFKILRCLLCESSSIEEIINQSRRELDFHVAAGVLR